MTYSFDGYNYTLRFEKGEMFVEQLTSFVREQNVRGGWIVGLGGLAWAELGFYDLKAQEYQWKKLDMTLELTSLTGNIAWKDGEPALHLHANVGDAGLQVYGGHLKQAEVAGTVEIFIHRWLKEEGLNRALDEQTGLNLLQL
jgi:predicted DNA-binding protein with PD1-like motif